MDKDIRSRVGQLFMLGFPSETPPPPFLDFLKEEQIGGVILFEENCRTHELAKDNIRLINSYLGDAPPLIAIDQEGGRVSRLRGAPAEFKDAADYGRRGAIDHYCEDYSRAMVLMASLGINLNLAPVADLALHPGNEVLKNRCFGDDPEKVSEFVTATVRVSHQKGMLCCLKHFPGLGAARLDPHKEVARTVYDRMVWQQRDRVPFAAGVDAGADLIMTTHLVAPSLDDRLVTESNIIVTDHIRLGLGFDGPVITDDLCMAGAESMGDPGERAIKAFLAGHDLLLLCHDYEAAIEGFELFAGAVSAGDIPPERVQSALERIAGIKLKLGHPVT
jgi:beta-N-acetylhexosaminidase